MAEATTRYRAFLSYSHKDADWGRWLHKELERFRVDRDLVGRQTPLGPVPPNLRPIFADREDFASSPSLKEATSRALEASEFLVVICSPRSAKSFHVNEEIRLFKASGKSSRVFPIIVDGEPNSLEAECFPPALKRQVTASGELSEVTEEPIAADARDFADGRELAKLKIVAGLLGIGLDEIRKRAARAARKRFVVLSGVAALMGLLAIAAGGAAWIAYQRQIEAEQRLEWALETASSVTSKTTGFKTKFGVPAPVIADLLQEVERLLSRLSGQGVKSPELTLREAKLYGALSDGRIDTGNTAKALMDAQLSLEKLNFFASAKGKSPETQNDIAWAHMKIGDILKQQNDLSGSKKEFERARDEFKSLTESQPGDPRWQSSLASALKRLADLLAAQGKQEEAKIMLDQTISIERMLVQRYPTHEYYRHGLVLALNDRGDYTLNSSEFNKAKSFYEEALAISAALAAKDPTNADWADTLAQAKQNVGISLERQGLSEQAIELYQSARESRRKISEQDPTNVTKLGRLAYVTNSIASLFSTMGRLQEAESAFEEVVAARKKVVSLDPSDASEKGVLSVALMQLGQTRFSLGKANSALSAFEEASTLCEELIQRDSSNTNVKASQAIVLGSIAIIRDTRGDQRGSLAAVEKMVKITDELVANDPTNNLKVYESFIAHQLLAEKYRQQDKLQEALKTLLAQKATTTKFIGTRDVVWLNNLSFYYSGLYRINVDLSNYSDALAAADAGVDLCLRWTELDKGSDVAKQQLALSYTNRGIAYRFSKKLADARSALLQGIEIRQTLANKNPNNLQTKSDLAISWSRLNDVFWDERNFSKALEAEQNALKLQIQVVQIDPSNVSHQADLAETYLGVGSALEQLGRKDEARTAFESALKIRSSLVERYPDRTDFRKALDQIAKRLSIASR